MANRVSGPENESQKNSKYFFSFFALFFPLKTNDAPAPLKYLASNNGILNAPVDVTHRAKICLRGLFAAAPAARRNSAPMTNKTLYMICIILISVPAMADTFVMAPVMADLARAFPGAGLTRVNLALTISSLFVIPASLLAGRLVGKGFMSKKGCLMLGIGLASAGGSAGGLVENLNFILFTRATLGVGIGLSTAMIVTITADYFTPKESGRVMGLYNAMGNLMGVGLGVAAGYLAVTNWRHVFPLFLIGLLIMAFQALVLKKEPETAEKASPPEASGREAAAPGRPNLAAATAGQKRSIAILLIITLLSKIFSNSIFLTLSPFIIQEGMGDASSTGLAGGVLTVGMVSGSFLFNSIYVKINRHTSLLFFGLIGLGFLFLAHCHSFGPTLAALLVLGLGNGMNMPYLMQESLVRAPASLVTFTGSLINSGIYLSIALSTFAQPLVIFIFNDSGLRFYFVAAGLASLACAGLALILNAVSVRDEKLSRQGLSRA